MSAQSQAKAKRRKMSNGYAHMGSSLRRPSIAGATGRSVAESIAAARHAAAKAASRSIKKPGSKK